MELGCDLKINFQTKQNFYKLLSSKDLSKVQEALLNLLKFNDFKDVINLVKNVPGIYKKKDKIGQDIYDFISNDQTIREFLNSPKTIKTPEVTTVKSKEIEIDNPDEIIQNGKRARTWINDAWGIASLSQIRFIEKTNREIQSKVISVAQRTSKTENPEIVLNAAIQNYFTYNLNELKEFFRRNGKDDYVKIIEDNMPYDSGVQNPNQRINTIIRNISEYFSNISDQQKLAYTSTRGNESEIGQAFARFLLIQPLNFDNFLKANYNSISIRNIGKLTTDINKYSLQLGKGRQNATWQDEDSVYKIARMVDSVIQNEIATWPIYRKIDGTWIKQDNEYCDTNKVVGVMSKLLNIANLSNGETFSPVENTPINKELIEDLKNTFRVAFGVNLQTGGDVIEEIFSKYIENKTLPEIVKSLSLDMNHLMPIVMYLLTKETGTGTKKKSIAEKAFKDGIVKLENNEIEFIYSIWNNMFNPLNNNSLYNQPSDNAFDMYQMIMQVFGTHERKNLYGIVNEMGTVSKKYYSLGKANQRLNYFQSKINGFYSPVIDRNIYGTTIENNFTGDTPSTTIKFKVPFKGTIYSIKITKGSNIELLKDGKTISDKDSKQTLEDLNTFFEQTIRLDFTSKDRGSLLEIYKNKIGSYKKALDNLTSIAANLIYANEISKSLQGESTSDFKDKIKNFYSRKTPNLVRGVTYNQIDAFSGSIFPLLTQLSVANDIHEGIMGDIVVKGGAGEQINSVILHTLVTNFAQFVREKSEDPESAIKDFSIQKVFKQMTFLRDYVDKTGDVKSSTSMNVEEFFINSFIYDFYGGSLAIPLGVLSDKPNIVKVELDPEQEILIEAGKTKKLKDCSANDLKKVAVRELGIYYSRMKQEIDRNLIVLSQYSPRGIKYDINTDYIATRGISKKELEQDIHDAIYAAQQAGENIEINELLYFSWDKDGNLHTKPSLIGELAKHDVEVNTLGLETENSKEFFERKESELVTDLLQDLSKGITFIDQQSQKVIDSQAVKELLKANKSIKEDPENGWRTRTNVIIGKLLFEDKSINLINKKSISDWNTYKNLLDYLKENPGKYDLSKLDINGDFDFQYFLKTLNKLYPKIQERVFTKKALNELKEKLQKKLNSSNSKIDKKALTEGYRQWRLENIEETKAEREQAVLNYETESDERKWRTRDTAQKMEGIDTITSLKTIEDIAKEYGIDVDTNFESPKKPNFKLKVNPELQRYNTLHYLYSEQGLNSTVGSHINHKAPYMTNLKLLGAIETGQQAKRNVSESGSKNQYTRGDIQGMNPYMTIATVKDIKASISTINGIEDSKGATVMDGSTIGNYVTRKEELYSLGSQKAGIENSKPLGNDLNPKTGTGTIIKTAVFVLTNGRIRASEKNIIMHKHMNNIPWSNFNGDFLHDFNGQEIKYHPVIVYKPSTGQYYLRTNFAIENIGENGEFKAGIVSFNEIPINNEILKAQVGKGITIGSLIKAGRDVSPYIATIEGLIKQNKLIGDNRTPIKTTRAINTNYELWDLFGGAYSAAINDFNELTYENDNTSLENLTIACHSCGTKLTDNATRLTNQDVYLPLKEAKIDWIVTEGAIKQGASNMNSTNMLSDINYPVTTQKISTIDVGMQLNPEHLVDKSHVTLMTQVVNALGLRGFSADAANRVYQALASLTDYSLQELFQGIEADLSGEGNEQFKDAVSSLLLKSIVGTSETDGDLLASIVVQLNKQERNGHDYDIIKHKLPISDPAILNKLISNFSSLMTKAGVRIQFPGSMNVLVPSDGIYRIHGGKLRKFASTQRYNNGNLIENNEAEIEQQKLQELQSQQQPLAGLHEITIGGSYFIDIEGDQLFYDNNDSRITTKDVTKPWKSDQSKINQTRRFYLTGLESLGYFELVADINETNGELNKEYSVHFKPTDSTNPNAFTSEQKAILFKAVADAIPYGAKLSTWGELSRGGVSGVNRFANLGFSQVGSRKVSMKTGEPLSIPLLQKTIKIDDLSTYYKVRELLNGKNYSITEDVIAGRELAPYNCTFNTDKGMYMLWDLDSIKHIHMIEQDKNNGYPKLQEIYAEYSDDQIRNEFHINPTLLNRENLNTFVDTFKKLINRRRQIELNTIGSGNENDVYINGERVIVDKTTLQKSPYELIAPKNYETEFGLRIGDDFQDIANDKLFFLKRLINTYYTLKDGQWIDNYPITSDKYDIILKTISGRHYPILYKSSTSSIPAGLEKISDQEFYSRISWEGSKVFWLDGDGNKMYELPYELDSNKKVVYKADILVDSLGNEVIYTGDIKSFVNRISFSNIDFGQHLLNVPFVYDILSQFEDSKKSSVKRLYKELTGDIKEQKQIEDLRNKISKLEGKEGKETQIALLNTSLNGITSGDSINNQLKTKIQTSLSNRNDILTRLNTQILAGNITEQFDGIYGQMIKSSAEIHTSFLKSAEYIVSRTPAQSHQSFMPMKLVAFDESGKNSAYVNRYQLYLQGSDYDVDKASLLGSIFKNGKYVRWSPFMNLSSIEHLKASETLPFPTGKRLQRINLQNGETLNKRFYDVIDKPINIEWNDNQVIFKLPENQVQVILNKISDNQWELSLTEQELGTLTPMEQYILERAIVDKLNEGDQLISKIDFIGVGINEQGIKDSNTIDYIQDFLQFNDIFRDITKDSLEAIPTTQEEKDIQVDMICRLGILLNAYNQFGQTISGGVFTKSDLEMIQNISNIVNEHNTYFEGNFSSDPKDAVVNYISSNMYQISSDPVNLIQAMTSVDQQTEVIKRIAASDSPLAKQSQHFDKGNIMSTFRLLRLTLSGKQDTGIEASSLKVMEAINQYQDYILNYGSDEEQKGLIKPINIGGFDIQMICNAYCKNIANIKSKEVYDALQQINNDEDQALWLSAFLSLSTDNAKDPTLSKINANPEMIGLYNAGFVLGLPINFLTKVIMSSSGMALAQVQQGNVFLGVNGSRNISRVLKYIDNGPKIAPNDITLKVLSKAIQAQYGDKEINAYNLVRSLLPNIYSSTDLLLARRIINLAKQLAYGEQGKEIEYNLPTISSRVNRELSSKQRQLKNNRNALDALEEKIAEADLLGKKHKKLDNDKQKITERIAELETQVSELSDIKTELKINSKVPDKIGDKYTQYREYEAQLKSLKSGEQSGIIREIESYTEKVKESAVFKKTIADLESYLDTIEQIQFDEGFEGQDGNHYYPLQIIRQLDQFASEMSLIRPNLGLNQQLPNSKENQINFIKKFENIIRDRLNSIDSNQQSKDTPELSALEALNEEGNPHKVDLVKFIWDENYRNTAIAAYESIKYKVNALDVLLKVPHYFGYLKACGALYKSLQNVSVQYREQDRIADTIIRGDLGITNSKDIQKRLKSASRYISRVMNNMFLSSQNVELTIPKIKDGKADKSVQVQIKLGTVEGNTAFKEWMDIVIIPQYKQQYSSNRFFKELSEATYHKSDSHNTTINYTTGIDSMTSNPTEIVKKEEVTEAFNRLISKDINGLPLVDAFFYYDLIAYDRQPGQQALTPIFNKLAALGNTKVISDYIAFVSDLDQNGNYILPLDTQQIDEIERFIAPEISIYALDDFDEKYAWVKDPADQKKYLIEKIEQGEFDPDGMDDPSQEEDPNLDDYGTGPDGDINGVGEDFGENYTPLTLDTKLEDLGGKYVKVTSINNLNSPYMEDFTLNETQTALEGKVIISPEELRIGNTVIGIDFEGNPILDDESRKKLKDITGRKNVDDLIVSKTLTEGSYHRKIIDIETTKANLENPCK